MLLAIDIGNTNITVGIFKIEGGRTQAGPLKIWRLATDKTKTGDEYGTKILDLFHYALIEYADIKAVAVASVVPALNFSFEEMSRIYFRRKAFFVSVREKLPISILYDNPEEVGADRIANAVAAIAMFGAPAIVIDFGTATTFDCINKKGEYIGGVIVPGPMIAAESLAKRTAKLPMIDIIRPPKVIGRSTIQSMQSGIYFGYVGLIREILRKVKNEMHSSPQVIATGGLAHLITTEIKEVKAIVNELTLEGIRIIWEKAL